MTTSGFDVFGTGVRTKVLLAISVLDETHATELARVLGVGDNTARNALLTLEAAGLVVGTLEGGVKRFRLNPRFRAADELRALLDKLSLGDPALLNAIATIRRRPRRTGKPL